MAKAKHERAVKAHKEGIRLSTQADLCGVVPAGWEVYSESCIVLIQDYGLHAVFSLDYDIAVNPLLTDTVPKYRHLSMSRVGQYPGWDEIKRVVYTPGLFDHEQEVVMRFPKAEENTVAYPYVLHFYQEIIGG